jgi:hypothetical protein
MKEQFMTLKFWIEIGIAGLLCFIVYIAVRVYNQTGKKDIKVDYFRIPTSNVLVVLGLLVPIMVALASYLYVNNPEAKYSSLLATIVVMFVVLGVAIWETFALLQKGQTADTVTIKLPGDRRYITGMGLMYALLLLSLFYFAMFFLFELPARSVASEPQALGQAGYQLMKPSARIDQTKDEILRVWGQPSAEDVGNRTLRYESDHSVIRLTFDENQKLVEINDRRK